jgi:hypothetical protein
VLKKIGKIFTNLGIIFVLSMLGAISGQGFKWMRRFVFPAIIMIYALIIVKSWWCLSIYSISGWLSMGYGIPDLTDEGSFLGRLFYKLFKGNRLWTNIMTRGTIGLLLSLSMISIPIIQKTWVSYLSGSFAIILIWATNSWQGYGEITVKLFNKEYKLLKTDITTYAVTSCGLLIIINNF